MGSVHERVVQALALEIIQGRIRPGQALPTEPELMDRLRASRSAVREAVRELAAKGLVETRRRAGTIVRPRRRWHMFDPDILSWLVSQEPEDEFLAHLIELRQVIEPAAARFAAMRATLAEIGRIDEALRAMDDQLKDGKSIADQDVYDEADVAFHLAIFEASHNPLIEHLGLAVRTLMLIGFRVQRPYLEHIVQGDMKNDDHRVVLERIQSGDPEGAARAAEQIIGDAKMALVRARQRKQAHEQSRLAIAARPGAAFTR